MNHSHAGGVCDGFPSQIISVFGIAGAIPWHPRVGAAGIVCESHICAKACCSRNDCGDVIFIVGRSSVPSLVTPIVISLIMEYKITIPTFLVQINRVLTCPSLAGHMAATRQHPTFIRNAAAACLKLSAYPHQREKAKAAAPYGVKRLSSLFKTNKQPRSKVLNQNAVNTGRCKGRKRERQLATSTTNVAGQAGVVHSHHSSSAAKQR